MGLLIAVAFARLFGFLGVLSFTYRMVVYTGNVSFLWLLGLIFTLSIIPTFGLEKGFCFYNGPKAEQPNGFECEKKEDDEVKSDDLFD